MKSDKHSSVWIININIIQFFQAPGFRKFGGVSGVSAVHSAIVHRHKTNEEGMTGIYNNDKYRNIDIPGEKVLNTDCPIQLLCGNRVVHYSIPFILVGMQH